MENIFVSNSKLFPPLQYRSSHILVVNKGQSTPMSTWHCRGPRYLRHGGRKQDADSFSVTMTFLPSSAYSYPPPRLSIDPPRDMQQRMIPGHVLNIRGYSTRYESWISLSKLEEQTLFFCFFFLPRGSWKRYIYIYTYHRLATSIFLLLSWKVCTNVYNIPVYKMSNDEIHLGVEEWRRDT